MLSGYLSLNRNISIKQTIQYRVPKVLLMKILELLFGVVAGILVFFIFKKNSFTSLISAIKFSSSHWWNPYLAILAGCYLVTPFLKKITEDVKLEEYFLVIGAFFCFVIPSVVDLEYVRRHLSPYIVQLFCWIDNAEVYLPVGSTFLFVLGHYLGIKTQKVSKKSAIIFICIGFFSWVLPCFYIVANPDKHSIFNILRYGRYYGTYVSPLITLYSASVFIFFKVVFGDIVFSDNITKFITHLARNSVLIYLLHRVVINLIRPYIPVFWVPSFIIETIADVTLYFIVAYFISLVLEHLPLIRKIF